MEGKPFISVVMPVYNVENYLRAAAESVLGQTFSDFELILVDDCSPDGSGALCDRLAGEDGRVRVIHLPQNGGLSNARNQGTDAAQGEYVYYMDSDDTIEKTLFADMRASLEKNEAKVVMFGFVEDYFDENGVLGKSYTVGYPEKLFSTKEALRREIIHVEESTLYGYACNKFYNLPYLRQIGVRFENVPLIEDIQFNVAFFMDVDSFNIMPCTPYHYNKRVNQSLTGKFVPEYFEVHTRRVQMLLDQYRYWGMYNEEVGRILGNIYVRYIFSALQRNCDKRAGMSHRDRTQWLRTLYQTSLYQELIPRAQPQSRVVKLLWSFLKRHMVFLCLASGRVIYIVKTKLPIFFAKAKQKR